MRKRGKGSSSQYVLPVVLLCGLAAMMTIAHMGFTTKARDAPRVHHEATVDLFAEEDAGGEHEESGAAATRKTRKEKVLADLKEETASLRGERSSSEEGVAKPVKVLHLTPEEAEAEGLRPKLNETPPYLSLTDRYGAAGELYRDAADFATDGRMKYREVSQQPRASYVENFWTDAEADEVLAIAAGHLARSQVVAENKISTVRTSQGMFINGEKARSPLITAARRRVSMMTGLSVDNVEATQVLRYDAGQFYRAHPDYFSRDGMGLEHLKRGGQRVATVLAWLNDVPSGGNTSFPNSKNPATGKPYSVPPKKGDAVVFWNCHKDLLPDSDLCAEDPMSFHMGEPPDDGSEKWVSVFWVRQRMFQ